MSTDPIFKWVTVYRDAEAARIGGLTGSHLREVVSRPFDRASAVAKAKLIEREDRHSGESLFFRFEGRNFEPFVMTAADLQRPGEPNGVIMGHGSGVF